MRPLPLLFALACRPQAPQGPTPSGGGPHDGSGQPDSGGPDSGGPPITATLSLGPVSPCDAPVPVERVLATAALGLDVPPPPSARYPDGTGLLAADLDGDGDIDLAQSFDGRPILRRHLWQGDRFVSEDIAGDATTRTLAGLQGDGRILATGTGLRWLDGELNAGELLFDADPGFVRDAVNIEGLGVFVALGSQHDDPENRMDQVIGGPALGARAGHEAFDAVLFDADGDGRRDVYVVNDNRGDPAVTHALWRVTDAGLEDITEASGLGLSMAAMGVAAGDVNGDGLDDLYITGTGDSRLMLNLGEGRFADATAAWGANPMHGPTEMGWGGLIIDENNDGLPDILVAHGDFGGDPPFAFGPQPASILRQGADEHFDTPIVLAQGKWRTILPIELNGDGVLDLIVVAVDGELRAYTSTGCSAGAWLAVDAPDGSRVRVDAGGRSWFVTASVDAGFGGALPPRAWIGLGPQEVVDRVEVRLPLGEGRAVLEGPIDARRLLRLEP